MKRILLILMYAYGCLINTYPAEGNVSDSSEVYFEDLTDLFTLRIYTLTKFNTLEIVNPEGRMIMRPNGNTNLGVGFNYKFLYLNEVPDEIYPLSDLEQIKDIVLELDKTEKDLAGFEENRIELQKEKLRREGLSMTLLCKNRILHVQKELLRVLINCLKGRKKPAET